MEEAGFAGYVNFLSILQEKHFLGESGGAWQKETVIEFLLIQIVSQQNFSIGLITQFRRFSPAKESRSPPNTVRMVTVIRTGENNNTSLEGRE